MLQDASKQRGQQTRLAMREVLERLGKVAKRKRGPMLRSELSPPLLNDAERGEGDSVNARMHRIVRNG